MLEERESRGAPGHSGKVKSKTQPFPPGREWAVSPRLLHRNAPGVHWLERERAGPLPAGSAVSTNVPKEKRAALWLGPRTQGPPSHTILWKECGGHKRIGGMGLHLTTFHLALNEAGLLRTRHGDEHQGAKRKDVVSFIRRAVQARFL